MSFRFTSVDHPEGKVLLLEIPAASSVPVKFNEIAYIRVGSTTPKLTDHPGREADLLSKLRPFIWEAGVAKPFLTTPEVLEALDHRTLFTLLDQAAPTTPEALIQRLAEERLIAEDVGGRWNILNLGAILFARQLSDFPSLTRKAIRLVEYDGTSRLKLRRSEEGAKGYAIGFQGLLKHIDSLLPSEERIEGGIRSRRRTYPEIALRELIANALVHQDMTITGTGPIIEIFDDRVLITNPGVPVTDMVKKLFGAPPRSRNEQMARLMRRMGICEELGSGILKVVESTEEYRLPAPHFELVDGSTRVTVFGPRSFGELGRAERVEVCYQHTCLMHAAGKRMTNTSLRERFGIAERNAAQVSRVIREAQDEGLIRPADEQRPKAGYVPFWV